MNDARKEAVAALPPGHQSMDKERNRLRDDLIGRPIKKMKAAGASEEAIEAFRAEKTKVLDKLAPLGSTVHGGGRKKKNWRKIEAEAKRTQEALDDDEELPVEKPRAKRQRTRVSKDARKPVVNDAESQVVVDDEDLTLLESGAADPECEAAEGADDEDDIIFLGHTMKRSHLDSQINESRLSSLNLCHTKRDQVLGVVDGAPGLCVAMSSNLSLEYLFLETFTFIKTLRDATV
jgi:hypothetical protein